MTVPSPVDGDQIDFLARLDELIRQRIEQNAPNSYVARLVSGGETRVAQKLGEEAVELALAAVAGTRREQLDEAADLFFHLLVLLNVKGIRLAEVASVLQQRHLASASSRKGSA